MDRPDGWRDRAGRPSVLVVMEASLPVDGATSIWFTQIDHPGWRHATARTLVIGGQFWLVGSAVILVGAWTARRLRSWRPVLVAAVAVIGLDIGLWAAKHLSGRTAPHSGLNDALATGTSYPSGHTASATVCLLLIVELAWADRQAARIARQICRAAVVTAAVLVGAATIVLGYHWLTDVIAGWLGGALVVAAARRSLARDPLQKPQPPTPSVGGVTFVTRPGRSDLAWSTKETKMADLVCPKCQSPMSSLERSGVTLERCTQCGGIFLDNGELERIEAAEAAGGAPGAGPAGGQSGGTGQELLGQLMSLARQYRGKRGRF